MIIKLHISLITIALLTTGCVTLEKNKIDNIHTNDKFIAQNIKGKSCEMNESQDKLFDYFVDRIKELEEVVGPNLIGGNSLTVKHDYISDRWSMLLMLTYSSVAKNNTQQKNILKNQLLKFAKSPAFLSTKTLSEVNHGCYKTGPSSPCETHTPLHYSHMYTSLIISAALLKDDLTSNEKIILDEFVEKIYKKYITPAARKRANEGGYYEFGGHGIGVIAYADYTKNRDLLTREFQIGKQFMAQRLENSGYIDNNSYRGVRAYFYHTLGADSMLSYALLMRSHGYDIFNDPDMKTKLNNLIEKTFEGQNNYSKFISKGNRGKNISTNIMDSRTSVHSLARNLSPILKREFSVDFQGGNEGFVSKLAGFNAECLYESTTQ